MQEVSHPYYDQEPGSKHWFYSQMPNASQLVKSPFSVLTATHPRKDSFYPPSALSWGVNITELYTDIFFRQDGYVDIIRFYRGNFTNEPFSVINAGTIQLTRSSRFARRQVYLPPVAKGFHERMLIWGEFEELREKGNWFVEPMEPGLRYLLFDILPTTLLVARDLFRRVIKSNTAKTPFQPETAYAWYPTILDNIITINFLHPHYSDRLTFIYDMHEYTAVPITDNTSIKLPAWTLILSRKENETISYYFITPRQILWDFSNNPDGDKLKHGESTFNQMKIEFTQLKDSLTKIQWEHPPVFVARQRAMQDTEE